MWAVTPRQTPIGRAPLKAVPSPAVCCLGDQYPVLRPEADPAGLGAVVLVPRAAVFL